MQKSAPRGKSRQRHEQNRQYHAGRPADFDAILWFRLLGQWPTDRDPVAFGVPLINWVLGHSPLDRLGLTSSTKWCGKIVWYFSYSYILGDAQANFVGVRWNLHQTVKGNYSDHPAWISRGAHTSRLSSCQLSRRGEVSKKKLMLSNDLIMLNVSSLATVLKAMIYCFRDHARYTNHLFRSWPCCSCFRWSCRWWGIKLSRKKKQIQFQMYNI